MAHDAIGAAVTNRARAIPHVVPAGAQRLGRYFPDHRDSC
jgi:hypothetical protein